MDTANEVDGSVVVPIGGVHPDIVMGNRTPKNGFGKVLTQSLGVTAGPAYKLPRGWKGQVEAPQTLNDVRTRKLSGGDERVVSRKVNGRWVVGAINLDLDDIEDILEDRGLEFAEGEEQKFGAEGGVSYFVAIWRPKRTAANE